jgi:hypothetical protein
MLFTVCIEDKGPFTWQAVFLFLNLSNPKPEDPTNMSPFERSRKQLG